MHDALHDRVYDHNEQRLGRWVNTQRATHSNKKKCPLWTETRRARLEMLLGWSWTAGSQTDGARAAQWEAQYVALQAFLREGGGLG